MVHSPVTTVLSVAPGTPAPSGDVHPFPLPAPRAVKDEPLANILAATRHALQPIVHIETGLTHGYEALLRGSETLGFDAVPDLFDHVSALGLSAEFEIALADRALDTFVEAPGAQGMKLFFNIDPRCVNDLPRIVDAAGEALHRHGLKRDNLCFEVSERANLTDGEDALDTFRKVRERGFGVALDDFGEGYCRLKFLHENSADYVKFDRFFVKNVSRQPRKRLFLANMLETFNVLGIATIAEGIETEEDLRVCRDLGFKYAQGYLIARPTLDHASLRPSYGIVQTVRRRERRDRVTDRTLLREQIQRLPALSVDTSMTEVFEQFRRRQDLSLFPVVDGSGHPLGVVREFDLKAYAYSPYGVEAAADRTQGKRLADFTRQCPIADINTRAEKILEMYSNNLASEGVIVVDESRYVGFLDANALLKVLSEKNLAAARDQNPLTKLPGNAPINAFLNEAVDQPDSEWLLIHFDLDNFKPFNDAFGFRQGDRVLQLFAEALKRQFCFRDAFIGHIGGDDFFVGLENADAQEITTETYTLRRRFEKDLESFYDAETRERGTMLASGRDGAPREFPLLSCSATLMLLRREGRKAEMDQVLSRFAELKRRAKTEGGFAFDILG